MWTWISPCIKEFLMPNKEEQRNELTVVLKLWEKETGESQNQTNLAESCNEWYGSKRVVLKIIMIML